MVKRISVGCALGLLMGVGCAASNESVPPSDPEALLALFPPAGQVQFDEVVEIPQLNRHTRTTIHQEWRGPVEEGGQLHWDVVDLDIEERTGQADEFVRVFYSDDGFGTLGVKIAGKPYEAWSPPQLVMPEGAGPSHGWSDIHVLADASSHRQCELAPAEQCAGGITSHCVTDLGESTLYRDTYFCPGVGFAGYRNRVEWPQLTLYMWTENVVVDGEAIPAVPQFKPQRMASPDAEPHGQSH